MKSEADQKQFLRDATIAAFSFFLDLAFKERRKDANGFLQELSEDEKKAHASEQSFLYAQDLLITYAKRFGIDVDPDLFNP